MSCSKLLVNYKNDILVETGSGHGNGISRALSFGFKEIHSIEIDKAKYDYCTKVFSNNKDVHLYLGDSLDVLPAILDKIKCKSTFLLDAHVMDFKEIHGKKVCPILEELKLVINHSKSLGIRHSVLVDDRKLFNGKTESFENIGLDDIKKAILEIDSSYHITCGKRAIVAI